MKKAGSSGLFKVFLRMVLLNRILERLTRGKLDQISSGNVDFSAGLRIASRPGISA